MNSLSNTHTYTHGLLLSLSPSLSFALTHTAGGAQDPTDHIGLTALHAAVKVQGHVDVVSVSPKPSQPPFPADCPPLDLFNTAMSRSIIDERWGAGVETPKNVRGEVEGWGRVPFNEPYTPSLSTIYDGA